MSYIDEITKKIKDPINTWIDKLKQEHPKLHLTKQWKVKKADGFTQGHVALPVITSSKKGKYLVGEVEFVVPEDLEFDIEQMELTLKNEPYRPKNLNCKTYPIVDEPLSRLNEMIIGMNDFLSNLNIGSQSCNHPLNPSSKLHSSKMAGPKLKVNQGSAISYQGDDIDTIRKQIKSSMDLPEWMKNITSREVYETLVDKISEGFVQYRSNGNTINLKEFFALYENYLKREGKLSDYCRYKSKPVKLTEKGYCDEHYCSKKPYHSRCEYVTLKFGG